MSFLRGLGGIKSLAVILNHQGHPGLFVHKSNVDVPGLGMLADIAHGFLGNAKEGEFRVVWEVSGGVIRMKSDREGFLIAQGGDIFA